VIRLPGRCQVCNVALVWDGKRWKEPRQGAGRRHVCREDRPTCGAWMPYIRERCARGPGHITEHRSRYAMDNALRMASGRRAA
jgi:hypothetical protein